MTGISVAGVTDAVDEPWDRRAIARGGVAALVVAVPVGFALRAVADGSSLKGLLFAVILGGFGWGGMVAAKADSTSRPLAHGSLAALAAVLVYLAIGLVARAGRGVSLVPLAFTMLLAVSCGIVGAELGDRRRRRLAASDDGPDQPGGNQP